MFADEKGKDGRKDDQHAVKQYNTESCRVAFLDLLLTTIRFGLELSLFARVGKSKFPTTRNENITFSSSIGILSNRSTDVE